VKSFRTFEINQSNRVVNIDVYYTIRPFEREAAEDGGAGRRPGPLRLHPHALGHLPGSKLSTLNRLICATFVSYVPHSVLYVHYVLYSVLYVPHSLDSGGGAVLHPHALGHLPGLLPSEEGSGLDCLVYGLDFLMWP